MIHLKYVYNYYNKYIQINLHFFEIEVTYF